MKMAKGKQIAPGDTVAPVASYGPSADFYKEKAAALASQTAHAMSRGDIVAANELYQRGVYAELSYNWYRKLAQCVGAEFTQRRTV
jgi:hypothetical protein